MTHPKHAQTEHEILDLIRQRWSPRAFDLSKDVSTADLVRLFEAARWAPSSGNEQPWRFLVARRGGTSGAFEGMLSAMTERNRAWAAAAPVLVLVAVRATLERNEAVNAHAWYDTGQAVGFLTLQATDMGLGLRQMAGFDRENARTSCLVPAPFDPAVLIAVGYPGDPESLAIPFHRETEVQPRQRRALSDFVYEETWGTALS
jgi:nitroreductase